MPQNGDLDDAIPERPKGMHFQLNWCTIPLYGIPNGRATGKDKNSRGIRLESKRNDEEQTAGNEDVKHEVLPALLLVLLAGLHAKEVTRGRLVGRLMVVGITAQAARRGREGSKGDGGGGRGEGAGPHVPGGSYRRVGSEKHHCFVSCVQFEEGGEIGLVSLAIPQLELGFSYGADWGSP